MLHTSDLSDADFAINDGKVVSKVGFAGPYEISEGTIADYENQSGKPELVWLGGTEADPTCCWVVFPDDTAVKIKWPAPNELGFAATCLEAIIDDLELGGGTREKYIISDLAGPTWQVVSVTYGEEDTEVDFSGDDAESLLLLMGALNSSENLPDDWLWSISGGYLVLSVPHGTGVTLVSLAGGLEMEFTAPSIDGEPASQLIEPLSTALAGPLDDLIQQYEDLLESYTALLGESVEWSSATTEANVESAYSAYAKVTVRWTDADGDPRVSYKTPTGVWYHPVHKAIDAVQVYLYQPATASSVSSTFIESDIDLTAFGIPEDARFVDLRIQVAMNNSSASSGYSLASGGAVFGKNTNEFAAFDEYHTHTELVAASRYHSNSSSLSVQDGGQLQIAFTARKEAGHVLIVAVFVQGWSR